jgi:hypothetical protein
MGGKKTKYRIFLSLEDELCVEFKVRDKMMLSFSLQYNAVIEGEKSPIFRIDTNHGFAHSHIYRFSNRVKKKSERLFISMNVEEYSNIFNERYEYMKKNFNKIKDNYLTS